MKNLYHTLQHYVVLQCVSILIITCYLNVLRAIARVQTESFTRKGVDVHNGMTTFMVVAHPGMQ